MKYKLLIKIFVVLFSSYAGIINVYAAKLYMSPSTVNIGNGQTGQIKVYVDTEGKTAFGVDGILTITGNSVDFTSISAGKDINSSEITSEVNDNELSFRILTIDGDIEGIKELAVINYSTTSTGNTTLNFVTGQNYNNSSVAEDVTGDELLTSTENATFIVGSGQVSAVCGNGNIESPEQCETNSACPVGYSCNSSCTCIASGTSITPTNSPTYPPITTTPTSFYTITGTRIPTITGTPNPFPKGLPKSAIERGDIQILLSSSIAILLGLGVFYLFSLPGFNIELMGTKLRIKTVAREKHKHAKANAKFEKDFD